VIKDLCAQVYQVQILPWTPWSRKGVGGEFQTPLSLIPSLHHRGERETSSATAGNPDTGGRRPHPETGTGPAESGAEDVEREGAIKGERGG
jgi:hypothetical protein